MLWPFEGRRAELALLRSAFEGTEADPAGVDAVLVTAPAGVGKTRLAREAMARLGAGRTVWVAGTRAGSAIPFGAVAALLPDGTDPPGGPDPGGPDEDADWPDRSDDGVFGGVSVMRAAAGRVAGWGGRHQVAVAVDDAHLLDDASATLIAHLVTERLAFALLTVRDGEPFADVLARLLVDGRGEHIELAELPDAVMDKLIDHAGAQTGTEVDPATRGQLRRTAAGNPLALRELLHGAQPGGLTELVMRRLGRLDPDVRSVVELVACGEPLSLAMLRRLAGLDVVVRAEDAGLIVVERSGRRRMARLDHPLYGEVLRSGLSVSRLTRTYHVLAGALLDTPLRRRTDALLAAVWQVEAGTVTRPEVVRTGARQAVGHSDLVLAERLARAARDAQPGSEADRLLAEILGYRGRTAEAGRVLAAASPPGPGDSAAQRAEWAVTRAETRYWGDGDLDGALATLDAAGDHPLLRASRSWLLFFDAGCAEAAAISDRLLARAAAGTAEVGPKAVVWAAASGCAAHGFLGRDDAATRTYERGSAVAAEHAGTLPWGPVQVDTAMVMAQLAGGWPAAAWTIALAGRRRALDGGAAMMVSGWALYGGLAALAQGHVGEAQRLLTEAQPGFEANDTFRLRRSCLAARAAAIALAGERPAYPTGTTLVARLIGEADALANASNRIFEPWIESWRAWSAYLNGDLANAVRAATRATELARAADMPAVEALAHYDLARFGAPPDRARLARLDQIDHEIGRIAFRAARALATRDGTAELEDAARGLRNRGYDLLAAELYATAGHRHRQHHRYAESELAKAHAAELCAAFPEARTPLLRPGRLTTVLTFRERQILLLAAEHTSAAIAELLRLSVATVNNNLARAYLKVGIRSRTQLRELLNGRPTP